MAALIVPANTPFGSMTNQTTSRLLALNTTMARLKDAIATASAGYNGTPGTEFEAANMMQNTYTPNNFGIAPDPAAAGANGSDYSYAVNQLVSKWEAFWPLAEPYVSQLDNGAGSV